MKVYFNIKTLPGWWTWEEKGLYLCSPKSQGEHIILRLKDFPRIFKNREYPWKVIGKCILQTLVSLVEREISVE